MTCDRKTHSANDQDELGVEVCRCSPVSLGDSLGGLDELGLGAGGKLSIVVWSRMVRRSVSTVGLHVCKLGLDRLLLLTLVPGIVPVDLGVTTRGGTDYL